MSDAHKHFLTPYISRYERKFFPGFEGVIVVCPYQSASFKAEHFLSSKIELPFSLKNAGAKRQAEFLAGRLCAQQAMIFLRYPVSDIGIAEDRSARWPRPLLGSISHHREAACCALAHRGRYRGVGVDLELLFSAELADSISYLIAKESELRHLSVPDVSFACMLSLLFSAKESLFKAVSPIVQRYFDFLDVELLAIDLDAKKMELCLCLDLSDQYRAGSLFLAHFEWGALEVLSLVVH